MVKTMAKLRMAHASTHAARKPPGPILYYGNRLTQSASQVFLKWVKSKEQILNKEYYLCLQWSTQVYSLAHKPIVPTVTLIFAPLDTVNVCATVSAFARPSSLQTGYCTVWIVERFGDFSHYAKYLTVHCALALCHCYHTIFIGGAYLETPVSVLSVRLVQVSL